MTASPTADRYGLALRRGWMWCALAAALGAFAFPVLYGRGRGATTSAQLSVTYEAPSLTLVEAPPDLLVNVTAFQADAAVLRSSVNQAAAEHDAGGSLDIGVSPDPTTRRIRLAITGASKVRTDEAFDFMVDLLRNHRRDVLNATLAEFDRSRAQLKPVALQRVADLDQQLRALTPSDNVLAQALQAERAKRSDDLLRLDNQREALRAFIADPEAHVTINERETQLRGRGSTVGSAILGAVLGLLLAVTVIVLVTHLIRRVRTRSDIHRLVGALPVVSLAKGSDDEGVRSLALFACRLARVSGTSVTVLTEPALTSVADRLRAALNEATAESNPASSVVVGSWHLPIAEGSPVSDTRGVVLVAQWGRTRDTSVLAAAAAVDAQGGSIQGVALAGVPRRFLEQAGL